MRKSQVYLGATLALMTLARCSCNSGAVGSCANGATCPANSTCNPSDELCFADDGGSAGSNGGAASGGTGGTYQCETGPCPTGYTCDTSTYACIPNATGGSAGTGGGVIYCPTGAGCPTGDICVTGVCIPQSGGTGASAGNNGSAGSNGGNGNSGNNGGSAANSAGSNGGSAGNNGGGTNGGYAVTGECFDGGTCPQGSTCNASGLCIAPASGGANSSGGYFFNGSGGGGGGYCGPGTECADAGAQGDGGSVITGVCSTGGSCPTGSVCESNGYCYGRPPQGTGGGWGVSAGNNGGGNGGANGGATNGGSNGGCSGVTDCNQSCSLTNPDSCGTSGLFCDPTTLTCQLPTNGEPCLPSVGCQGAGVTCAESKQASGQYACFLTCTDTQDCSVLLETCQPSQLVDANTCEPDSCSNYFLPCDAAGSNDGTCLLPGSDQSLTNCPSGGCGLCMQGGSDNLGDSCDTSRGNSFCEPAGDDPTDPGGMVCAPDVNQGSNTACMPMCSPLNGPTLCPLGQACYWPVGSSFGTCLIPCPVDPLCPGGSGVGSDCGFCGDTAAAAAAEAFLCLGSCCITGCPGNLSCQFLPGTPILACLP